MKKYLLLLSCLPAPASAQFAVEGSGLNLVAGTTFSTDGLVLIPTANLTLANTTITRVSTAVPSIITGASIQQVSRFSAPILFSGTVGIKYPAGALNGNAEGTLQIAYGSQSSGGAYVTTTGSSTGATGSYYVSKALAGVTLGQVTATNSGVALPIGLAAFSAEATGNCSVKISWTAAAPGRKRFLLQRSTDARSWQTVGEIPASEDLQHTLLDAVGQGAGKLRYRLAMTDDAGATTFSNLLTVEHPCNAAAAIRIFPNPAGNIVTLESGAPLDKAAITLTDASGSLLKTLVMTGTTQKLDLSSLAPGIYIISCRDGGRQHSWRLVHQ